MHTVADFMTPDPRAVRPGDSLQHAAQLMDRLNVGALPVLEGHTLLGIVTDRDITVRATAQGLHPDQARVDQVMSAGAQCCTRGQSTAEALLQMGLAQIRRLPVLDDEGRLVGIVSLGDLAARQPEKPEAGVERALGRISMPAQPDRP